MTFYFVADTSRTADRGFFRASFIRRVYSQPSLSDCRGGRAMIEKAFEEELKHAVPSAVCGDCAARHCRWLQLCFECSFYVGRNPAAVAIEPFFVSITNLPSSFVLLISILHFYFSYSHARLCRFTCSLRLLTFDSSYLQHHEHPKSRFRYLECVGYPAVEQGAKCITDMCRLSIAGRPLTIGDREKKLRHGDIGWRGIVRPSRDRIIVGIVCEGTQSAGTS